MNEQKYWEGKALYHGERAARNFEKEELGVNPGARHVMAQKHLNLGLEARSRAGLQ